MVYEKSLWEILPSAEKPIVIYGTGDGADKLIDICEKKKIKISGIFASDEFCRHQYFRGFRVKTHSETKSEFGEMIILLAFAVFDDGMISKIKEIASENEFYAPSLPMFKSPLFDIRYFSENIAKIEKTKTLLSDDISKRVFDDIINYRLSGKISYLFDAETKEGTFSDVLPYSENDVYFDLGAYNGDTAAEFDKFRNGRYKKMYLVEPNEKILKKLYENTASFNAEILNFAVFDSVGEADFNGKTGRSAGLEAGGKVKVRTILPDMISETATVIKYDVEGAEIEALSGTEKLIKKCAPSLIVSAYHKTGDIFDIPEKVLSMHDYNVYLRHKRYIPDWDTLYYFIKK